MDTDDQRRALNPKDASGPGWRPLTPDALAADLASTHPHLLIQPDAPHTGGMGAVYRALDSRDGQRPLAIKVIRPDMVDLASFIRRFQREEAILRTLIHEHIVRYHSSGQTAEGYHFIVMDWVEGRTLTEFLTTTRDKQTLLTIFRDVCSAVAYAHAVDTGRATPGILHRDLKPANIIVTPAGRAVVLDWGIARPLDPERTRHTLTGDTPGTRGYIAPEVEAGAEPDQTADIYALGILFYQLFMKRLPTPSAARPSEEGMDPAFDTIFRKAAAEKKIDRYQSAAELLGALTCLNAPPTFDIERSASRSVAVGLGKAPRALPVTIDDFGITIDGKGFYDITTIAALAEAIGSQPREVSENNPPDFPYEDLRGKRKFHVRWFWDDCGICAGGDEYSIYEVVLFLGIPSRDGIDTEWASPRTTYSGRLSFFGALIDFCEVSATALDEGLTAVSNVMLRKFTQGPRAFSLVTGGCSIYGEHLMQGFPNVLVQVGPTAQEEGRWQAIRFEFPSRNRQLDAAQLFTLRNGERALALSSPRERFGNMTEFYAAVTTERLCVAISGEETFQWALADVREVALECGVPEDRSLRHTVECWRNWPTIAKWIARPRWLEAMSGMKKPVNVFQVRTVSGETTSFVFSCHKRYLPAALGGPKVGYYEPELLRFTQRLSVTIGAGKTGRLPKSEIAEAICIPGHYSEMASQALGIAPGASVPPSSRKNHLLTTCPACGSPVGENAFTCAQCHFKFSPTGYEVNLATGERTSKRVKTAEAFSGVAIAGSLILLLYLVIARGGEGWQVAAALFVAALCWKWWARLMKWLHHD